MKFFQAFTKPTNFKINKGNIKLVQEDTDYSIKYPDSMEGDIEINQINEDIVVELKKDFPSEGPVIINLNSLSECNVNLNNGIIELEHVCPIMKIKIDQGNLSAKLSKYTTGSVKAHVNIGVLANNSDLQVDPSYEEKSFGSFWGMGTGFNNHIELMGTLDYCTATFEVGSGIIDLL